MRIGLKLHHNKAAVRLNLLRIISSICDSSDERGGLLARYDLLDAIRELEDDPAVLVRDMAGKLIRSSEESESLSLGKRKAGVRRRSTSTLSRPSTPSSPQLSRSSQSRGYLEGRETPRHSRNHLSGSALAMRPGSRDGNNGGSGPSGLLTPAVNGGPVAAARSRISRGLNHGMSHNELLPDEEDTKATPQSRRRSLVPPRRRRRTVVDAE